MPESQSRPRLPTSGYLFLPFLKTSFVAVVVPCIEASITMHGASVLSKVLQTVVSYYLYLHLLIIKSETSTLADYLT